MDKNGWIPVGEQLPESLLDVVVCTDDGCVEIGYFSAMFQEWSIYDQVVYERVVAWQPLPQPYKSE